MEILDNKAILITTRRPQLVTECIRKSQIVETNGDLHKVAVHWGLDEAQALNKLKIKKVPSPIHVRGVMIRFMVFQRLVVTVLYALASSIIIKSKFCFAISSAIISTPS